VWASQIQTNEAEDKKVPRKLRRFPCGAASLVQWVGRRASREERRGNRRSRHQCEGEMRINENRRRPAPRYGGDALQEPCGRMTPTLEMLPPSTATKGAWTSPQFSQAHSAGHHKAMSQPQIPEALRAFLHHLGELGSARARHGLVVLAAGRPPVPVPLGLCCSGAQPAQTPFPHHCEVLAGLRTRLAPAEWPETCADVDTEP
jgi:hypothetical protein